MIHPTRFGLKYAPVPTLALEYEEDVTTGATASLYVYRDGERGAKRPLQKKLHVVELPALTRTSEPHKVVAQLQRDNERFLAPTIVKEEQLRRLLQKLIDHITSARGDVETTTNNTDLTQDGHAKDEREEQEEERPMEDSFLEESMPEASMEASTELPAVKATTTTASDAVLSRGKFLTQQDEEDEDQAHSDHEDDDRQPTKSSPPPVAGDDKDDDDVTGKQTTKKEDDTGSEEGRGGDMDADAAQEKKKALKSESEISEEEVQSEELEYFSEDASDEDSF
ncbi:TPA: hypothetical protein N0F65_006395 [Lagenidium giganteum]|uniref:Centrosomal protein of 19 kDa n=1 Tax=Lagenidium giganteum TaxID=4803 RepID=A0AAV2YMA0_9STRA|nr:TPA: hypothetical protein N0F65_006395 [Lagenidium giganteum]